MAEPMPEIETGDWVHARRPMEDGELFVVGWAAPGECAPYAPSVTYPRETQVFRPDDIIEIRKPNGTVWRRDGGQP